MRYLVRRGHQPLRLVEHGPALALLSSYAEEHPEAEPIQLRLSRDLLYVTCGACPGRRYRVEELHSHVLSVHGTRASALLLTADQVEALS